ncbi:hypothetical protein F5050DRAFT_1810221 [Lentinula boryana]|uniref:Uncharacterized protein n=1 Tax=Lentinula boryana TaxID=40481 RepID=A0ABQ8Q5H5_9AGAR|nr:hypothetical protein F5050DRAFT_1810221 [Lentinula boryana]
MAILSLNIHSPLSRHMPCFLPNLSALRLGVPKSTHKIDPPSMLRPMPDENVKTYAELHAFMQTLWDVHLHVILHGLWGTTNLGSAARVFSARHCLTDSELELAIESQDRVRVHLLIEASQQSETYDGIVWGAERAVLVDPSPYAFLLLMQ